MKNESQDLTKDIDTKETENQKLYTEQSLLQTSLNEKSQQLIKLIKCNKNQEENFRAEINQLKQSNVNLEESLNLMRNEFEEMESYWQKKIEEERNFYHDQLKAEEAQFLELEKKIHDYESCFRDEKIEKTSLFVIEEHSNFEDQIFVLEEENMHLRMSIKELLTVNQENYHIEEPKSLPIGFQCIIK